MSLLSPLLSPRPSPHLKRLHTQPLGLDGVTRTPCLTRCSLCLCHLLLPRRMGSPLSPLFWPGCTWQNMGDALSPKGAQMGPTLPFPAAFVSRVQTWRSEAGGGKNDHRTKQEAIYQYFLKCDSFISVFSEAAFLNTLQGFLHRLPNLPVSQQHSKETFSLSHLKNKTNPPHRFSQLWGQTKAAKSEGWRLQESHVWR